MHNALQRYGVRLLVWAVLSALGCLLLARWELAQLRDAFETDARISHRLLSQRAVQHDAVLATLALLQPNAPSASPDSAEQRLSSVYPQILGVQRRDPGGSWSGAGLEAAEQASRQARGAVLANLDFNAERPRYQLVLAGQPASFALLIDVQASVPWADWSMPVQTSPVRVTLEHAGQAFVVQPGHMDEAGWRFEFHKHLASSSQPFDVVAIRQVLWVELPWALMVLWVAAVAAAVVAWSAWQVQRSARRRAEELLRVGQVARLNTLGELAAGMEHELNQPLTAILANTQAAKRLLNDEPPELPTALRAMDQAVAQARRAADVLARLRRTVEPSGTSQPGESVELERVVRSALDLLEPECKRRAVAVTVQTEQPATVFAERVAMEQIVHNLLTNALQALDQVPATERQLMVHIAIEQGAGVLRVADSGPGIAPDVLPRVFEPFFTTREGGLGLGLSLCETLVTGMGGALRAQAHAPRGALFFLSLPLAPMGASTP
ncbi:MAG TPA: ATP-binding protein [Rhodoferax sp.]|jgi:signal transduction histidine kinase|nr:ATP-binding protein [Rhodoferax sp.]HNV59580.1 ATP-binding protein [Rhodoferax sp.]HPW28474.1 ATP-binding protein [Rhodoferax sp.]